MERANQTGKELESLWEKLENLKRLESSLVPDSTHTIDQLRTEITERLGFFPPLFSPALQSVALLESLWRQQISSYYDNPLPRLFKEKLGLRLSRYCASSYFIVAHACALYQLGISAWDMKKLLESPVFSGSAVEHARELLAKIPHPIENWPEDDPAFEGNLVTCCVAVFLGINGFERCAAELREILGSEKYGYLTALLANIKASHLWAEAHSEISAEDHPVVRGNYLALLRSEPRLEEIFRNHREVTARTGQDSVAKTPITEDPYRELFENASDIIYTHDFEGKLLSINRAVERISGYTRAEALQMSVMDVVAPEYEHLARRMIDPQVGGEIPLHFELEFIAKDKSRITLGISTRPIFRGGKAVAVQGIARDITKRKKTEAALQEANQKLEAWVTELEQRTRGMTLLNEMGDILRACMTTEEAYHVIVRVAQQIFPVKVGALYVIAASRNVVEAAAVWGDNALVENSFSPQECWALRRGRTHWAARGRRPRGPRARPPGG